MTDSKCIDSSVWINYFYNERGKEYIDSSFTLLTSLISIFEIKKKFLMLKQTDSEIKKVLEFIKRKSIIIPLDESIVEEAAHYAVKNKLATVDALIYVSTLKNNAELVTYDNDFRGLPQVKILE